MTIKEKIDSLVQDLENGIEATFIAAEVLRRICNMPDSIVTLNGVLPHETPGGKAESVRIADVLRRIKSEGTNAPYCSEDYSDASAYAHAAE